MTKIELGNSFNLGRKPVVSTRYKMVPTVDLNVTREISSIGNMLDFPLFE